MSAVSTKPFTIDAKDYYGDFHEIEAFLDAEDGYEGSIKFPSYISNGSFYLIKLRPGLLLFICNHYFLRDILILTEPAKVGPAKYYQLNYLLSGSIKVNLYDQRGFEKTDITYDPGIGHLSYMQNGNGAVTCLSGSTLRIVNIIIAPWLMDEFLQEKNLYSIGISSGIEAGMQKELGVALLQSIIFYSRNIQFHLPSETML